MHLAAVTRFHALMDRLYAAEMRSYGVEMGSGVRVKGRPKVLRLSGSIQVGDNVTLTSRDFGYHTALPIPVKLFTDAPGAIIRIGNRCKLKGVAIHAKSLVDIGEDSYIGYGIIIDQNGHVLDAERRVAGERDEPAPIRIGRRCWITHNHVILKGVTIGDDVVLAAGSVVTADLPAGTLCGGQPARVLRDITSGMVEEVRAQTEATQ
jgi:acetyltransferase-like isoleucine patch superfamily enzyme